MTRLVAYLVVAFLTLGCRDEAAAPASETTSIEQEEVQPNEEAPVEAPQGESAPDEAEEASDDRSASDAPLDEEKGEPLDLAAATPRDLGVELRAAVGVPTDCLVDFTRATPTTIRVSVTAVVRPSGAIIQPTASGTGLSRQAEQCVARRVDAVVLTPLEDDVSQRVSTVIEIPYEPPREVVGTKVGQPDPELRNVRQPLPSRREAAPSGRPVQEPTSRSIQEPTSRPIQDPSARKPRGPKPRPIDGWDVDESAKEWR